MGMFNSLNISASGLTAQRFRLDVISNNIANVNTTRTTEGAPFKRSEVVLRPREDSLRFKSPLLPNELTPNLGSGVRVIGVEEDESPGRMVYDPSHPDAIQFGQKKGYVEYPNVNVVKEMVDMIMATRAYEANVTVLNDSKNMFYKAIEIGYR